LLNFKKILLCVQFPKTREYKTFIHIFLLFIIYNLTFNISKAQNLVYNGDFEIYDTCPTQPSSDFDKQLEHTTGWTFPTKYGTSDYFNSCASTSNIWTKVNVPDTYIGYQEALSNNGYCGIYAYFFDEINGIEYGTEYIQTKLLSPLILGKKYSFKFHVSLANFSEYAITEIGAYFSKTAISRNDAKSFNLTPQISSQIGMFLTDTLNWMIIEGEFIADGGEEYLTIGNFKDSSNTDTLNTGTIYPTGENAAYYFIDGVILEESLSDVTIPNIITPNGDEHNDQFLLNFPFEKVAIYNRWGNRVFESINNDSYWDGRTTSGSEVPEGTYYYVITTTKETYKGFIQLLR